MSVRDREDAVVARLSELAPHLDGEPDPAFRAATRARLVAMAAVRTPAPPPVSPIRRLLIDGVPTPARWRARLTAGLAGAALTVTALATLVAVADGARPGDLLYDIKRGTEQTQLALAGDARGQTLLDLAATRLDEVRSLVDDGATALPAAGSPSSGEAVLAAGADPALVVETLDTMDAQTAEGAAWLAERAVTTESAAPLQLLSGWAAVQSDGVAELQDDVPAGAEDDVAESLALLADIATRVTGLESSLDCPAGPAVVGADELGPVPALCLPEGSTATPPGETDSDGSVAGPGSPGSGTAGVPPVPGSPAPSTGGTVPGVPGAPGVPGVPSAPRVPGLPTKILPPPTSSLPAPTLPSSPLTGVPRLPGTSALPAPTATPLNTLDVCLGPIAIGNC
jgi:hypothetical protein